MSIRSKRALLSAASAALVFTAAPAAAQLGPVNPFSFGVSAGAAVPVGDFGDGYKTGYGINGLIGIRVPASPVSFRGEVGYTRNDFKGGVDGHTRIISGVANILLSASPGPTVVARPYLIGGVGIYNGKTSLDASNVEIDDGSDTKFGLNGGVGVELPLSGISAFAEARFVSIFTEDRKTNYIPITVGIRF